MSLNSSFRLHFPIIRLEISKRNYAYNAIKLWNISIGKILDPPILSVEPSTIGFQYIISGNTVNSDLTISVGLFKKILTNLLVATQISNTLMI